MELQKINDYFFTTIFESVNDKGIKVTCILDNDCVRFTASEKDKHGNYKIKYKHYFKNNEKEKCYKLATRYLNK